MNYGKKVLLMIDELWEALEECKLGIEKDFELTLFIFTQVKPYTFFFCSYISWLCAQFVPTTRTVESSPVQKYFAVSTSFPAFQIIKFVCGTSSLVLV